MKINRTLLKPTNFEAIACAVFVMQLWEKAIDPMQKWQKKIILLLVFKLAPLTSFLRQKLYRICFPERG